MLYLEVTEVVPLTKPHLDLDAVLEDLCQARLVGAAPEPELVAVGAVAHKAQLRHVRPRAPVGAPCSRKHPVSATIPRVLRIESPEGAD